MASVPSSFFCPITSQIMADPVSTSDGFSYEREAIEEWFTSAKGGEATSPMTGAPCGVMLTPNHALRQIIQEFIDQNPAAAADLYRPSEGAKPRGAIIDAFQARRSNATDAGMFPSSAIDVGDEAVPLGDTVVPVGMPVDIVRPPAAQQHGLSAADLEYSAAFAVGDWVAHCQPQPQQKKAAPPAAKKPSSSGWFGLGRSTPRGAVAAGTGNDEPKLSVSSKVVSSKQEDGDLKLRASEAEGGGVKLEADIVSDAALLTLARRLAAAGSAPIAVLKINSAQSGFGPGTSARGESTDAFKLMCRALATASAEGGGASLAALRELSVSKLTIDDEAAEALALALGGHPTLEALELWNVGLTDTGARHVSMLAAPGTNPTLTSLNLGRNLLSPDTRSAIEGVIDRARVKVKLY